MEEEEEDEEDSRHSVTGVISTFYSRAITQQPQQQNHTLSPQFHSPPGRCSTLGAVLLGAIVAAGAVVVDVGLTQGISSGTYVSRILLSETRVRTKQSQGIHSFTESQTAPFNCTVSSL